MGQLRLDLEIVIKSDQTRFIRLSSIPILILLLLLGILLLSSIPIPIQFLAHSTVEDGLGTSRGRRRLVSCCC